MGISVFFLSGKSLLIKKIYIYGALYTFRIFSVKLLKGSEVDLIDQNQKDVYDFIIYHPGCIYYEPGWSMRVLRPSRSR